METDARHKPGNNQRHYPGLFPKPWAGEVVVETRTTKQQERRQHTAQLSRMIERIQDRMYAREKRAHGGIYGGDGEGPKHAKLQAQDLADLRALQWARQSA